VYLIVKKIFLHNRSALNIYNAIQSKPYKFPIFTLWSQSVHDLFRIVNMRQMILTLIIMIQTSLAHDAHGLGNRKDFKYQDSWTVKLLRHLTGNWFSFSTKSLQNRLDKEYEVWGFLEIVLLLWYLKKCKSQWSWYFKTFGSLK